MGLRDLNETITITFNQLIVFGVVVIGLPFLYWAGRRFRRYLVGDERRGVFTPISRMELPLERVELPLERINGL